MSNPKIPFILPEFGLNAFNCPHCHVYANQCWSDAFADFDSFTGSDNDALNLGTLRISHMLRTHAVNHIHFSFCSHCRNIATWFGARLAWPASTPVEPPSPDLPQDIQADYSEAAAILSASPRSAAALLRLCVQKLCIHLGEPGKNINADIGALVKKGLPAQVQQALDTVRVIGNNAVHPGNLDLKDDPATAHALFRLLNFIAEQLITQPREIQALFAGLPEPQLKQIETRDAAET